MKLGCLSVNIKMGGLFSKDYDQASHLLIIFKRPFNIILLELLVGAVDKHCTISQSPVDSFDDKAGISAAL